MTFFRITNLKSRDEMMMELVWPAREHLPGYVDALEREWSADNVRREVSIREQLDPADFLP